MRPSDDVMALLDALLLLSSGGVSHWRQEYREARATVDQHPDLVAVVADWHRERYGEEPPWPQPAPWRKDASGAWLKPESTQGTQPPDTD